MENLSATTKELIFEEIMKLNKEIDDDINCAIKMQKDQNSCEFAEFRFLIANLKEKQIEIMKKLLFNK